MIRVRGREMKKGNKVSDDMQYVLENANKYIKDISGTIENYREQLENLGVFDDVQAKGIIEMFKYIKPRAVIDEAIKNYKAKKSFR